MKLNKYTQNLRVEENKVYSYNTHVATISGSYLIKEDWNVNGRTQAPTTSRHINYVASTLNLWIKSKAVNIQRENLKPLLYSYLNKIN
mgnify:CR=1 FL=1